jgi:hypothetical protein
MSTTNLGDATKLGEFLSRAITGEDKSALAEAIKAWNDENELRHEAEDALAEAHARIAQLEQGIRNYQQAIETPCHLK